MDYKAIEAKLLEACTKAEADGLKISPGTFSLMVSGGKYKAVGDHCCPVTALVRGDDAPNEGYRFMEAASSKLGITTPQLWSFIQGFDDRTKSHHLGAGEYFDEGMYIVGLNLRAAVLPRTKERIKAEIMAACMRASADGLVIVDETFNANERGETYEAVGRCCPITACVRGKAIVSDVFGRRSVTTAAAACLGIAYNDVWAFINGFDGYPKTSTTNQMMWEIGSEVRQALLGNDDDGR